MSNKLVVFDRDYQITSVTSNIPDGYEYTLSYVKSGGNYYLSGATTPFIVVEEFRIITTITKQEVITFMLEAVLERLKAECEKEIQKGVYSQTTGKTYYYGLYDQLKMTQQLAMLSAKSNIALNPDYNEDEIIIWLTIEGEFVPHSRKDFFNVCLDAEAHTKSWMQKNWQVAYNLSQTVTEYHQLSKIESFMTEYQKLQTNTTEAN